MPIIDTVKSFVSTRSPTEYKVKEATDESEISGATGTLMNEISILTYSTKTNKEITQVIKKRLSGANSKGNSHRVCIQIIKTLTLVSYLLNNGSNEFIAWIKSNLDLIIQLKTFSIQDDADAGIGNQISAIATRIQSLIQDEGLLEQRRKDVIQFRSSVSTPGRKSTDNSHLKWQERQRENLRASSDMYRATTFKDEPIEEKSEYHYIPSRFKNYTRQRVANLDPRRRRGDTENGGDSKALCPLTEEETLTESDSKIDKGSSSSSVERIEKLDFI